MKRSVVLAIALALAAVVWVGSGVVTEEPPAAPTSVADNHQSENEPVKVRVADLAEEMRAQRIVVTGRTNAIKDAEIKAETSGKVVKRPARKGSFVKKGTVLLELAMDDRGAQLEDAKANVGSAMITYKAAKDLQRKQFESQVRLAESNAELATAEAELAAIRLDIARTKIRAPIDGYIETLLPGPGDFVESGDEVAMVVDLDPIRVVAQVTEREVGGVKVDDLATVTLPDGREVGGTVHYVARVANDATRTFRVDIWIDNPDGAIQAGLTAAVELNAGASAVHKVPSSALTLSDQGKLGVRTVGAANVVQFSPVKMMEDTPEGTWVSGLAGNVRVIVVGQEFVIDGQEVVPVTDVVETPEDAEVPKAGDES